MPEVRSPCASTGGVGRRPAFDCGAADLHGWTGDPGRFRGEAAEGHGTLDWTDVARIPEEQRMNYARFELADGDILVSLDRPLISTGVKVAMVRKEDLPCLLLQRVGGFQMKRDCLLPEFPFGWLHSPHFTGVIDPGQSNSVPHISRKDIVRIPFSPPPIAVQEQVVSRWRELRRLLDEAQRTTDNVTKAAEALLPAILNRAFAGEL